MSLNACMDGLKASLAAAFPAATVQRDLPQDVMAIAAAKLQAGVLCLVVDGGGDFGNYYGREGELGHVQVNLIVFLQVAENTAPSAIEVAELNWLDSLLTWCGTGPFAPASDVLPQDWTQSKQLEHPYGWLILKLDVQF
ncbi:MAG TPA: hypothetical protein VD932_08640 [Aquabacterium sp.]|nr:hypothetical protein [Aquabacterium sp.]